MNRLSISWRLALLTGVLSLLLLLIGGIGVYGNARSGQALRMVYADHTVPITQLAEIQYLQLRTMQAVSLAQMDATEETTRASTAEVAENTAQSQRLWDSYRSSQHSEADTKLAQAYWELQNQYLKDAIQPALASLQANELFVANTVMRDKARPLFASMRSQSKALLDLLVNQSREQFEQSSARNNAILALSLTSIALGLLLAAFFGWSLWRGITRPLGQAVALAHAVAQGDLSQAVAVDGNDEIATLMRALDSMQTGLIQVVSAVRAGSERVAASCAEIAQGNQDLSIRTEHQAAALEETAASMEDLRSNVQQNARGAEDANRLAVKASQVASDGGVVVGEVVQTMKGINTASQRIADIIGVIDGIAFQTNILALNAAVEAARAGEQGRGFAVVASEVRSLAGRSAEAAREIKSLIQASVERVDQGSTLVDQAGATMDDVVRAIREATDIMGTISSASAVQSAGVAQIGEAVSQMDQTTQQNAALVEQMAAAASSLRTQAEDLVRAVSIFHLAPQAPQ